MKLLELFVRLQQEIQRGVNPNNDVVLEDECGYQHDIEEVKLTEDSFTQDKQVTAITFRTS